ncbi:MAG: hypothetical protein PHR94_15995 [Methylomonas lenta]|nr:hypothetical protein [Methylomonas lenta]
MAGQLLKRNNQYIINHCQLDIDFTRRCFRSVNILPNFMVGVCGHAFVEVGVNSRTTANIPSKSNPKATAPAPSRAQERFNWWKDKKEQVITQIREEGLEIDENIALEYISPKSRDWERGTQVTVRDDLRKDLNECLQKLAAHTDLINDFNGWHQVLLANPGIALSLDHEDWLFFFGQGR